MYVHTYYRVQEKNIKISRKFDNEKKVEAMKTPTFRMHSFETLFSLCTWVPSAYNYIIFILSQ